jgi:hypothetical protein
MVIYLDTLSRMNEMAKPINWDGPFAKIEIVLKHKCIGVLKVFVHLPFFGVVDTSMLYPCPGRIEVIHIIAGDLSPGTTDIRLFLDKSRVVIVIVKSDKVIDSHSVDKSIVVLLLKETSDPKLFATRLYANVIWSADCESTIAPKGVGGETSIVLHDV